MHGNYCQHFTKNLKRNAKPVIAYHKVKYWRQSKNTNRKEGKHGQKKCKRIVDKPCVIKCRGRPKPSLQTPKQKYWRKSCRNGDEAKIQNPKRKTCGKP